MNKVLEFIMSYLLYFVCGCTGVWLGSLIMGTDINPLTSWLPYVIALVMSVSEYLRK